jgi:hypothetical protein
MYFDLTLTRNLTAVAALCAQFLIAPAATAAGESREWVPDILGFKLGMPLNDVTARMNALNIKPNAVPQRVRSNIGEYTSGITAVPTALDSNDAGIFRFRFSPPPRSDRIVHVDRQVDYAKLPGKAPMASDLESALVKKFGAPTGRQGPNGLIWIWSPAGKLQTRGLGTPCDMLAGNLEGERPNVQPHALKVVQSGCGVVMKAFITPAPSGVVTKLSHQAVDVAGGVEAWQAAQAAAADQAGQKNQQDADRARQQKPSI